MFAFLYIVLFMSPRPFTLDDKNVTRISWPLKDVVSNITLFFFPMKTQRLNFYTHKNHENKLWNYVL